MSSTVEQSMSTPSIESPLGTTTDLTENMNKREKAVNQPTANMDRMSTFLGQMFSRSAKNCLTGPNRYM